MSQEDLSHLSRPFYPHTSWYVVRDLQTRQRSALQLADPDNPPEGLEVLRDEQALDRNGRPRVFKPKVTIEPSSRSSSSRRGGEQADQAGTSNSQANKEADPS